ncbi:hypothetical protein LZL87_013822 [Fusarium oxysporum]|nr:hypothetical protein LZL87_013822 [Fusarium oxysporum]
MARLKSSSRSRKPGLISRPQQLLNSSCITPNRLARQDASARRTNLSTWSPEPCKTQSPPKTAPTSAVVQTLRTSSRNFPDLNADGVEYLDLTNDAFDSDSLSFSSDAKLWAEDYASRPNLVASSGRKRKSSEISEEEFSVLGTGTCSPTPSSGNPSGTRRRDGSRGSQTRRTRDGFKNHLSTEISPISEEGEDEILSPSRYVHRPLAHEQSPRKALPVIDTQHPSKGLTSPLKESAVNSEASNPVHQTNSLPPRIEDGRDEPFIPDSDGEFLMPPSHNSSIAVLKVPTNKPAQICTHAGPTVMPAVQPDFASLSQRLITPGIAAPRVRAIASNSSQTAKATPGNSFNELPSINERWPKEKRSEVKSEKERLLRQQKAFKRLTAPTDKYRALYRKREELTQVITQAYAEGLDTDEDEVRFDDLTDEIQAVEQAILKTIDGTGLDVAGFLGTFQKPTHGRPPASVIVKGTQPMFQKSINISIMSDVATHASERGTREAHETQLPKASQNRQYPATSRIEASQRTSVISQGNNAVGVPLFPKDTANPSNAPHQSKPATRPSMVDLMPLDAEFDVGDDGFSDLGELQLQPVLKAARNLVPGSRSPPQATHRRPGDEFSDFSDDEEMLAFALDYETRQSHVPISQDFREVVSEITGNAGAVAKPRTSSKKLLTSVAPESIPGELMKHPWSSEVQRMLKDRFRIKGFRHNQLEAINATLGGKDAFVLMLTGGSKSLCYQLPAVIGAGKTQGITIVVSPLLSLMQDQVNHMKALGIQAVAFNSEYSAEYKSQVMTAFEKRSLEDYIELLYITPEIKLILSVQVPEDGANNKPSKPRSKQASKKPKDQDVTAMPSPYVSLPIRRRKKKSHTVESDDENGAMAFNGNANEGLMVNDNEDEEAFEVLPDHQPLKPLSRSPG